MCSPDCCLSKPKTLIRRKVKDDNADNAAEIQVIPTPQSLLQPYESLERSAEYIISRCHVRPRYGIICGTGLSRLATIIEDAIILNYMDIPNFPVSTVEGHQNKLFVGTLRGATVMAMQGRAHAYEGVSLGECITPVRVMKLCGVEYLFISNAAGAINLDFELGDLMFIHDHFNFCSFLGNSPLQGPNEYRFGPRFVNMVDAYDKQIIENAVEVAFSLGIQMQVHRGVYACVGGPQIETMAEARILRNFGVDAVGSSTVHEVIAARHCGMKVFAFCLITGTGLDEKTEKSRSSRISAINRMAKIRETQCCELIERLIYNIHNDAL